MVPGLEQSRYKARSLKFLGGRPHECRGPRTSAILLCFPSTEAGSWIKSGATGTRSSAHMRCCCLQGEDLACWVILLVLSTNFIAELHWLFLLWLFSYIPMELHFYQNVESCNNCIAQLKLHPVPKELERMCMLFSYSSLRLPIVTQMRVPCPFPALLPMCYNWCTVQSKQALFALVQIFFHAISAVSSVMVLHLHCLPLGLFCWQHQQLLL